MTPEQECQQAGFTLDLSPPLADARRPLVMAFRQQDDGDFLAVVALEVERFEIREPNAQERTKSDSVDRAARFAHVAVNALSAITARREFAHVIASRAVTGQDGAVLRVGWLAFGRGATAYDAAMAAEATWVDVHAMQVASVEHVMLSPVTDGTVLVDLLRPLMHPHAHRLARVPATPLALVQSSDVAQQARERSAALTVLPPWPASRLPWSPMVSALAAQPGHSALCVTFATRCRAPLDVVGIEEEHALLFQRESRNFAGTSVRSSLLLGKEDESFLGWMQRRIELLRGEALCCRVVFASSEPVPDGVLAVASTAFASPSTSNTKRSSKGEQTPVEPAVCWKALAPHALIHAPDLTANADLLIDTDELHRFARTVENPEDEKSPLPCARARHLDMRCVEPSGISLGVANLRGRESAVRIDETQRFQHMHIIGQTGTGKSTLMLQMITDDIRSGKGVTVLDPHGTLVDAVLERVPKRRAQDVVVISPSDLERAVPLNPLYLSETDPVRYSMERDRVIDELLDVFDALYDLRVTGGPMFEMYFRTFTALLMGSSPPTDYTPLLPMLEMLIANEPLRRRLASRVDGVVRAMLETVDQAGGDANLKNMAPYVTSKLTRFYAPLAARRMLCQPTCLDFSDVLASQKILLVSLNPSQLGREASALIARQIIFRLNQAAVARGASPDHPAHFLYVDEFQNYATERFAQMLSEARKFRLGLVLAHQYTTQLTRDGDRTVLDAVLGNVGTVVAFRLGALDAVALERTFAPRATAADISGLPNFNALVRCSGGATANVPFTLRTRPLVRGNPELGALIHGLARVKSGTKGTLVDAKLTHALREFRDAADSMGAF
ncbi:MAG: type IV secretory system conjugative DNA transfer family protein [Polyangiaceae bacterium]|nr:type IV secretory system conjugative DNA transfer family protein [Polyangiaceae bacterium]